MCGIAGIFTTEVKGSQKHELEGSRLRETIERMTSGMSHRGPDDQATTMVEVNGNLLALGHTRLTILDLSSAGRQPMFDPETGNVIVYNGEIYNFRELRERLGGQWRTQTDTEIVLRAYARWGRDCLEHLRGMFAFALWDAGRQELLLTRDRLGIKPLYCYRDKNFFVFASEVRTLLASGLVPKLIDPVAVSEYLAYQTVPSPRTLIKGVEGLAPGSWLSINARGNIEKGSYWNLLGNTEQEASEATEAATCKRVGDLLREAVASHLVSDVPVGAFLSGGIDSSAVVGLIREAGYTPRTFSVVFAESDFTEAKYARLIAERFRTDHTEISLNEHELLDQLPHALEAMDQPTGDGINTYVVSRAVQSAGVKVALSGLGGDEFFAGYSSFNRLKRADRFLRLWGHAPASLRGMAARTTRSLGSLSVEQMKAASILETDGSLASVYPLLRQVLSREQRGMLLKEPWLRMAEENGDPYVRLLREELSQAPRAGTISRISYAEGRTYMHDVLLRDTDQMSMAHSLEVRVPLLDHKLVEYVMGLPDDYKRPNGTPKRLLVKSLNGLLPPEIVKRPKQGFTFPFDLWMRNALRPFCEERLRPERVERSGLLQPKEVWKLWQAFLAGERVVSWSRLWVLVVLEDWMEKNGVACEE